VLSCVEAATCDKEICLAPLPWYIFRTC
jgi:hypothetical protein